MSHPEKASILISVYPIQPIRSNVLYSYPHLLSPTPWLPPLQMSGSNASKNTKKVTKQGKGGQKHGMYHSKITWDCSSLGPALSLSTYIAVFHTALSFVIVFHMPFLLKKPKPKSEAVLFNTHILFSGRRRKYQPWIQPGGHSHKLWCADAFCTPLHLITKGVLPSRIFLTAKKGGGRRLLKFPFVSSSRAWRANGHRVLTILNF